MTVCMRKVIATISEYFLINKGTKCMKSAFKKVPDFIIIFHYTSPAFYTWKVGHSFPLTFTASILVWIAEVWQNISAPGVSLHLLKNINDYTGIVVHTLKLMPGTTDSSNESPLDSYWWKNLPLDNVYIFSNMMFSPASAGKSLCDVLLVT